MILNLVQKHTTLQKKSTTKDEWCGPCPVCGGRDRFVVWPSEGETGRFLCRKCGKSGDAAGFLMWVNHSSRAEACAELNLSPKPTRRLTGSTGAWRKRPTPTPVAVIASVENTDVGVLPVPVSGEPTDATTPVYKNVGSPSEDASASLDVPPVTHHVAPHEDDEHAPDFVVDWDCWGGCVHFYHRGEAWECRTLDGNYDLKAADMQCPKLLAGYRAPLPDGYIPPLPVKRAGI